MMKIHLVGDEIAKGQGVGRGSVVAMQLSQIVLVI